MSSLSYAPETTCTRKTWIRADEQTESAIYDHQPELFWTDSPEIRIINNEIRQEQRQRVWQMARVVNQVIAGLPEAQRTIIYLRYFNDGIDAYTAKMIADKLNISLRTYYNYLNEACATLRREFEAHSVITDFLNTAEDD